MLLHFAIKLATAFDKPLYSLLEVLEYRDAKNKRWNCAEWDCAGRFSDEQIALVGSNSILLLNLQIYATIRTGKNLWKGPHSNVKTPSLSGSTRVWPGFMPVLLHVLLPLAPKRGEEIWDPSVQTPSICAGQLNSLVVTTVKFATRPLHASMFSDSKPTERQDLYGLRRYIGVEAVLVDAYPCQPQSVQSHVASIMQEIMQWAKGHERAFYQKITVPFDDFCQGYAQIWFNYIKTARVIWY